MKIKIEHLAPYLPYGLKARFKESDKPHCRKYVVGTIGAMYVEKSGGSSITCYDTVNAAPVTFMPVLRPLADLYRTDLSFNQEILDSFSDYSWSRFEEVFFAVMKRIDPYEFITYENAELLIKNHYDIFFLIERGLAFDINDLK